MTAPVLDLVLARLRRQPIQATILFLAMASASGSMFAGRVLERGREIGLARSLERLGADLVAVPRGAAEAAESALLAGEPANFTMDRKIVATIAAAEGVERTSTQLFLKSLTDVACCSQWNLFLIAFDPETDFTVRPWLDRHPARKLGPDDVLAGAAMIPEEGDTLRFYGRVFTLAGKLDPSGSGLDATVFIPRTGALAMARESAAKAEEPLEIGADRISAVMIKLKPEAEGGPPPWKVAFALEEKLPEISVIQADQLTAKTRRNLAGTLDLLRLTGGAAWPAAILLLGLAFALAVNAQKREFGVLRAVGAPRWYLFRLVLAESLLLGLAGGSAGVALAGAVLAGFVRLIAFRAQTPWLWPEAGETAGFALAAIAAALAAATLAGLLPAIRAARLEPHDAMRGAE